jgi:collagen type I/II/III/V/XI/XXIV/XXVII alpha
MSGNNFTVGTEADLNRAIETVDTATLAGNYTISLSGDIDLSHAGGPSGLYVLSLGSGVDVVIEGNGHTINGEGASSGLAVTTGHVSVSDLTIEDALAHGGAGGGFGGGGGAGLGGGLFVGPDAVVSISDVTFDDDSADGGSGGPGGGDVGGGHSSLVFAPLGNGGTAGTPGEAGDGDGAPGGTGGDGTAGGYGIAGGDGGDGGHGGQPGTDDNGASGGDGGNGGKGAMGGIGGDGGAGGNGGGGGSAIAANDIGGNAGDAGNGGDGGDGGDAEYGAGGGAGGDGGVAGGGQEGGARTSSTPAGESTDGGDGGKGGKGGDGDFGGGGGPGGHGADGGVGGTSANGGPAGANGGAGGDGGDGGDGDFGGGGGGGGAGGNGGRAGAGISAAPGSAGPGGRAGNAGLGGFGGGKGADGEAGYAGPTEDNPYVPPVAIGGAGGGGLGAGGAIFVADGGQLTVDGGLLSGGTVTGGAAGGPNAGVGSAYGAGIFIQGNDTITLATPDATVLTIGNVIADEQGSGGTGSGALAIGAGGTVNLAATNTFTGGVTITGGTLELSAAGAAGSGDIVFDAAGDPTLAFAAADAPANTITGLGAGDFIAVTDKTLSDAFYAGNGVNRTLRIDFSDGGGVTLAIGGDYAQADFSIQNNEVAVSCFLAGTHVMTEAGETRVEDIVAGDCVITDVDGVRGVAPVLWVGRRALEPARHPQPEQVQPVRISRDAFGPSRPHRDLFLSPDHAIYAEGVLIPVKHLINGTTIAQVPRRMVTYLHLELAEHAAILAEGLPCESYLDTGDRDGFAGGRMTALHPVWGSEGRDIALLMDVIGFAPLRVAGAEVDRLRAKLAEQASAARCGDPAAA